MPQSDAPREVSETAEPTDSPIAGADATFGDRAVAFLIDAAVAIALVIAGLILTFIVGFVSSTLGNLLGSVVNLVGLAYILTRDCLPQLDGLGVGKKVMKIRAVTMDGKPLTGNYEKGVIRNLPLIVAIVEVIVLIVRKDNHPLQRLGDDFAKTKVVKES